MPQKLTQNDINKKKDEIEENIKWLKNNWRSYIVKPKDISTKNIIIMHRQSRKAELAKLANNLLESICDETKLEMDIMLYILSECVDDYKEYFSKIFHEQLTSDDINKVKVKLPNKLINAFPKLWGNLKKGNELTSIQGNLGMIKLMATNGELPEKSFFEYYKLNESIDRYKKLQKELAEIRKHVKDCAKNQEI